MHCHYAETALGLKEPCEHPLLSADQVLLDDTEAVEMLILDISIFIDVINGEDEAFCPINGSFNELLPLELALSEQPTKTRCR